ncbi:MAG: helix-turn-helix domain-containing protein [Bdellovibrio sp.]|nr:helix-turn-helix domain-containing protein [Bdellovibrio sp.]
MSKRSQQVVLSKEGLVLKQLRIKHNLTMKKAAAKSGLSDTMISFIENGRAELPKSNDTLEQLLKVYGGISKKYFYELVRDFKEDDDDLLYLSKILPRLSPDDLKFVRQVIEMRLKGIK